MISVASIEDAGHIYNLTEDFNERYYGRPLNADKTKNMIATIIEQGVCYVSNEGYIGGMLMPDLFRDDVALVEIGWFARDRTGIQLLDAFINRGWELGVDEVRMCTMGTSPASAGRLLERRGFNITETSYQRLRPQEA